MDRDQELERAIRQRDVRAVCVLMLEGKPPRVKSGFRTEAELWDFKADCPRLGKEAAAAWADVAVEVLGLHNQRGGVLVFGIRNDYSFAGATTRLDSKEVNDQLRRFLGDRIWVEYHREFIQPDQKYVGVALVPPRGPTLERFRADAPELDGVRRFRAGDSAIREGDSTRLLRREQADQYTRQMLVPSIGRLYAVDEPLFRILNPEYVQFVQRIEPCARVEEALRDARAAVTSIIGIGGVGKTALATWAVLRAYDRREFEFIVSITAKDRELTATGITALQPGLTSFETLLNSILDVLGFPEHRDLPAGAREKEVRQALQTGKGLLCVDNLETVDDARVIRFLDSLPLGTRAITTSRRTTVRVSVHPVDLGPLTEGEVAEFIGTLSPLRGFGYVSDLMRAERVRIGDACDRIPLAIRWCLARSGSAAQAVAIAESVTSSGRRGEELLEFCFRRVLDGMPGDEKAVLEVLSLFQRPLPAEALSVGAQLPHSRLLEAIDSLTYDALVQRLFDADQNDYCYALLPITRAFVYSEVKRDAPVEERIRRLLTDWYEARDVKDPAEHELVRGLRQGRAAPEGALLDLAQSAERKGDLQSAQRLYQEALARNPRSWRAARLFAEFHRHQLHNLAEALRLYERAAACAPSRGSERALIYREWGMLLRDSGEARATDLAIGKFEVALEETPNDVVTIHALAHMLNRKGAYRQSIPLLEPLLQHSNPVTRQKTLPLLLEAYDRTGEILKAAELRAQMESEETPNGQARSRAAGRSA